MLWTLPRKQTPLPYILPTQGIRRTIALATQAWGEGPDTCLWRRQQLATPSKALPSKEVARTSLLSCPEALSSLNEPSNRPKTAPEARLQGLWPPMALGQCLLSRHAPSLNIHSVPTGQRRTRGQGRGWGCPSRPGAVPGGRAGGRGVPPGPRCTRGWGRGGVSLQARCCTGGRAGVGCLSRPTLYRGWGRGGVSLEAYAVPGGGVGCRRHPAR